MQHYNLNNVPVDAPVKEENAPVKEENAPVKGENAQVKGENAQVKGENEQVNAQVDVQVISMTEKMISCCIALESLMEIADFRSTLRINNAVYTSEPIVTPLDQKLS